MNNQLPLPLLSGARRTANKIPASTCEYENHPMKQFGGLIYEDAKNDIPYQIRICHACYARHILKYYPESILANYIQSHPDDYKPEVES